MMLSWILYYCVLLLCFMFEVFSSSLCAVKLTGEDTAQTAGFIETPHHAL